MTFHNNISTFSASSTTRLTWARYVLVMLVAGLSFQAAAQNMSINANGAEPDSSAMLDISDSTRGVLIPRMTSTQMNAIANPAEGLLIYNSSTQAFYYYNGTVWSDINAIASDNDWDTTLTSVYTMKNAGIGVINPSTRFQVSDSTQSRIRIVSADTTWTGVELRNASSDYRLYVDQNRKLLIRDHFGAVNRNRLAIDSTGKVGLGTTSPTSSLHLSQSDGSAQLLIEESSSTATPRTLLQLENNGIPRLDFVNNNNGQTWRIRGGDIFGLTYVGSGNPEIAMDTFGNIGIGVLPGNHKLEVAGNVFADSLYIFDGANAPTAGDVLTAIDATGRTYWGSSSAFDQSLEEVLLVDSNANGHEIRNVGKLSVGQNSGTGVMNVSGDTLGDLTIRTTNNANSQGIAFQNSGNAYTWSIYREDAGSNNANLVFRGGNSNADLTALPEVMRLTNSGNVGIGVTTPQAKLDVGGEMIVRTELDGAPMFMVKKSTGPTNFNIFDVTGAAGGLNTKMELADSTGTVQTQITTGVDPTYFDNSDQGFSFGGRTSSVIGDFNFVDSSNSGNVIRFAAEGAGVYDVRLRFDAQGSSKWFAGYDASGSQFRISEGNWPNPVFVIDSATHFVGIGVTNPTGLLSLNGNGAVNDVGITQNNVAGASSMEFTTADASSTQATRFVLRGGGNNPNAEFYSGASGSESVYVMFDGSNQRVGIGTTSPSSQLHLNTDGSLTGGMRVSATTAATVGASIYMDGAAKDWTIYATNSSAGAGANKLVFRDYSSGADRMTIDATGQVGIGTTNPSEALDVVGNIEIPAANDYTYASAKTEYWSTPAHGFQLLQAENSGSIQNIELGGFLSGNSTWVAGGTAGANAYMYCPINLPDGATITEVIFYVFDNTTSYECSGNLMRKTNATTVVGTLASTGSTGVAATPGTTSVSATGLSATLDYSTYSYFLRFNTEENEQNLRIFGARITYTVTRAN